MRVRDNTRPWPFNLCYEVFQEEVETPENLSEVVDDVLSTILPRERHVLILRFRDKKTLRECGDVLDLSRARIHQIEHKAIRKLRHPTRNKKLRLGDDLVSLDEVKKTPLKSGAALENIGVGIENLHLSVRAFNCLYRADIHTVKQLIEFLDSGKDLKKIRNMGEKTAEFVLACLETEVGYSPACNRKEVLDA